MDKLTKVTAEIERLIGDYNIKTEKYRGLNEQAHQYYGGKRDALSEILKSIGTMQKEPVSEELEEAAKNYPSAIYVVSPQWGGEIRAAFKAGANWQKEQFEKDYTNLCNGIATAKGLAVAMAYDKGMADAKEQMMKDAVDGTFSTGELPDGTPIDAIFNFDKVVGNKYEDGEKVKVIVIKES